MQLFSSASFSKAEVTVDVISTLCIHSVSLTNTLYVLFSAPHHTERVIHISTKPFVFYSFFCLFLPPPAVSIVLCQTWARPRVSAFLTSPTHPPLFTGWFQEPGWTATESLMCLLTEVSVLVEFWLLFAAVPLDSRKPPNNLNLLNSPLSYIPAYINKKWFNLPINMC